MEMGGTQTSLRRTLSLEFGVCPAGRAGCRQRVRGGDQNALTPPCLPCPTNAGHVGVTCHKLELMGLVGAHCFVTKILWDPDLMDPGLFHPYLTPLSLSFFFLVP